MVFIRVEFIAAGIRGINNIGKQSWILQIFYPTNKNKLYIFFVETRWGINLDMHSWT